MDLVSSITFTTQPKGSFSTSYSGPVGTYPVVGEARFSLAVSYDALTNSGNVTVLPAEFALHAAYPNPFNPSTTIGFDLPETGKVSLSIYDLKGALVGTLLNESKVAGTYQYKWTPTSELASGMYLFELKTKTRPDIKKLHTLNRSIRNTMNKYYILFAAVFTAIAYSQGIDFPTTPAQAPIGGLGLLAAGGAALAYKKLRKK